MAQPRPAEAPPTLPKHAHERIADMKAHKLFTCDLSINEFLLVREAGFDPLGLVMGTSIYQILPLAPQLQKGQPGCELYEMTKALYHLSKAVEIDPEDATPHYRLSVLYRKLGRTGEAEKEMQLFEKTKSKAKDKTKDKTTVKP